MTLLKMGRDRLNDPLPLLIIDKNDRGISIATLRIFGNDGKLGTKIDGNAWVDNSNFHSTKINPHQLIVRDDQDQEVLNLYYINEHAVRLSGIFRHPKMDAVEITSTEIIYSKSEYLFGCINHRSTGAVYFFEGPPL